MTRMSTWSARPAAAARSRASCACGSLSVIPVAGPPCSRAGVDRDRAPAAADVQHAHPRLEAELRAHELELGELRLLQRLRPAGPDGARVRHRLVEKQR